MAKSVQKKIRDLTYEYNILLDRFETMEKKHPTTDGETETDIWTTLRAKWLL